MKTLQPLCVTDVGLAAGNVFGVPGIDQRHREPALFQDLVDRNPVDPGGFHDDRLDPALFEPVGQPMQIVGEGIERPDRFGIPVRTDGRNVHPGADVDRRRVRVHWRHVPLPPGRLDLNHGVSHATLPPA
jgi:hypothetical protein